jgi:hypothetical protein
MTLVLLWGSGLMDTSTNLLVFVAVLAARLIVPLFIPRYPLPAVITALVLDGIDQTIFQRFTTLELDGYQGYDKALDIYYLVIAYIATMRNWDHLFAFNTSRFLLYFRLVGVLLFQLTHARALLLIFPNTFEYFFIFYEAVRLRWNPIRMTRNVIIGAAAFIWIVIKLPQEWWIHIAQRDVTDTLAANPVLIPVLGVAIAALIGCTWWVITHHMPPADRSLSFAVEPPFDDDTPVHRQVERLTSQLLDRALAEKIVLVSLVTVIFAQILPDVRATPIQLGVGVSILIIANSAVSEWLIRRGIGWSTAIKEFLAMGGINVALVVASWLILPGRNGSIHVGNTLFFLLLITLLITLYDRYSPYHMAREELQNAVDDTGRRGQPFPAD